MSIDDTADTSRRVQYTATAGQTVFDYDFRIFDDEDLKVYVGSTLQTLNSDYTVTGVDADTGGTVVFLAGLDAGDEVTIYSDTLIERSSDYQQNGEWTSARLNREFDLGFVIDQEQRHSLSRTLRGSVLEDTVSELPTAASRANKYLYFNASGQPTAITGDASDPLSVQRQTGTTTAGQTVINTDYEYTPGANHLALYIDGLRKVPNVHYTETDSDTITLLTPASAGQRFEIIIGEVSSISLGVPVKQRYDQTMSAGQTAVTISGWTYAPLANQIEVYGNGALLRGAGIDYTETNSTTVTLASAAPEGYQVAVLSNVAYSGAGSGSGYFAISDREVAAGVTPADYSYPWGHLFRYGAVNDGATADTAAFTQMLSAHPGSAYVPYTGTAYYTGKLTIPSNTRLVIEPGVIIYDSGSLLVSESLLNITGSQVVIDASGASVQGYAYGTTGTARHNVLINGGSNVRIRGLLSVVADMDCFHIMGGAQQVTLDDCQGNSGGRDGLRIVSARGIRVTGRYSQNDECGIRVMPGANTDYADGIRIIAPTCRLNAQSGIRVNLENVDSATRDVDIEILSPWTEGNGTDDTSAGIEVIRADETQTCRGTVRVTHPTMVDETCAGLAVRDWAYNGPHVLVTRPVVVNPNQTDGTTNDYHGGIILHATAAGGYVTTPGNVRLIDPVVIDNDNNLGPAGMSPFSVAMDGSGEWTNVVIENPESNATSTTFIETEPLAGLTVSYNREKRLALTSTTSTASPGQMGMVITNDALGATHTVTLPSAVAANVGLTLTYEVMEAQYLELDPAGTQQIRPGSGGAGYKYRSNTIGSRVTIRVSEAGYWNIINQTGTWASVA